MKLFDLHSDTPFEAACRRVSPVTSSELQAPLGLSPFDKTHRVAAIWCNHALDDNACYDAFLKIHAYTEEALFQTPLPDTVTFTYAVEDARLVSSDLNRLAVLHEKGVRILTLMWKDLSSVGGAWNTEDALTPLGRELVKEAKNYGFVLDISHASFVSAKEILQLGERYDIPVIASHSNSFSVCAHKRNLTDYLFCALTERQSLVGISMVPEHLSTGQADISTILSHIACFLTQKNGEKSLALGSDFDGTDTLPAKIQTLFDLPKLYSAVESAFGKDFAAHLFYDNAARFFEKSL